MNMDPSKRSKSEKIVVMQRYVCYIDRDAQGGQGMDRTAKAQIKKAQNGNTIQPRGESSPRKHGGTIN